MTTQSYNFITLFRKFIKDTEKGQRLKKDGKKIKKVSVENYRNTLKHLENFEQSSGHSITIRPLAKYSKVVLQSERKYWKKFYTQFTGFLYKEGCFDNYVGSVIKCLRAFFNYLLIEKQLPVGNFHKEFFVVQQEIPIVTLMPEQLQFLISNIEFEKNLPVHLQFTKDIFVVGCAVALRFSDLIAIKWTNVETKNGETYLCVQSQKSDTISRVVLPDYVLSVFKKYEKYRKRRSTIFSGISLNRFNINIRAIVEKAGYVAQVGKVRSKQGVSHKILHARTKKPYRFCDLISSHVMRRTAVTIMLMHGVPEITVKQISGHSGNSKAFYRYVNLAQTFMDKAVKRHFEMLNNSLG